MAQPVVGFSSFKTIFFLIYLRVSKRASKRQIPICCFSPQIPAAAEVLKPETRNSILFSQVSGENPTTRAITCCLAGNWSRDPELGLHDSGTRDVCRRRPTRCLSLQAGQLPHSSFLKLMNVPLQFPVVWIRPSVWALETKSPKWWCWEVAPNEGD